MKFKFNETPSGDSGSFELLEPGNYSLTISGAYTENKEGKKYIKQDGTEFIRVSCVEKESGLRINHFVFLDSGQSKKVYYFLKAIDLEPTGHEVDIDPQQWVGRMFRGKIDKKTGNDGIERNVILTCNPIPGEQPEPKDPEPVKKNTWGDLDEDDDVPF